MFQKIRTVLSLSGKDKLIAIYIRFCLVRTKLIYSHFYKIGRGSYVERPLRLISKGSVSIGSKSFVKKFSWLLAVENESSIEVGSRVEIGNYMHVVALRKVVINDYVLIADRVFLSDCSHGYSSVGASFLKQPLQLLGDGCLSIGEGAWIGEGVAIIGANIGRMSIVGANSVVTSDIPDYSIAVGAPAKVVKKYDFDAKKWVSVG